MSACLSRALPDGPDPAGRRCKPTINRMSTAVSIANHCIDSQDCRLFRARGGSPNISATLMLVASMGIVASAVAVPGTATFGAASEAKVASINASGAIFARARARVSTHVLPHFFNLVGRGWWVSNLII